MRAAQSGRGGTVLKLLIVDDEINTRRGIIGRLPLNEMGFDEICEADDGINGVRAVSSFAPDIILTDVRMPRMNGVEMVYKIRELYPTCIVIFMSGYSDKEYLKSAIDLKAISYIEKPINMNELKSALQASIALYLEETDKKKLLSASLSLIRNELALQLINRTLDASVLAGSIKASGLDVPQDGLFATVLLRINANKASVEPPGSLKYLLDPVMAAIKTKTRHSGLWAVKNDDCIIVHLFGDKGGHHLFSNEKLENACRILLDELSPSFPVFLSLGKTVNGIYNVYSSYESAVLGMQKAFYYGYNRIIRYGETNKAPYQFASQTIKEFSGLLLQKEQTRAEFLIKSTASDIRRFDTTLVNQCKDFYYKLLLELVKASSQHGNPLPEVPGTDTDIWELFLGFATLEEMENFIIRQMSFYFQQLAEAKPNDRVIAGILQYIGRHYQEENMTVGSISEHTHLTPAYLSVVFKKATGKTLVRYINEYRMEKSKELLQNKKLKISDIAARVGCGDSNYFTKIFRRTCGLTPSEYRERML